MAFNSWHKLSKAQHDYPKPKFAVAVVEKNLKKAPKNPYLLAWRADLYLQQDAEPAEIKAHLEQFNQLPTLTDLDLLDYLYRLRVEALRRSAASLEVATVGEQMIKLWIKAAQSMQSNKDRLELWNRLFKTAMLEECWEDVSTAVIDYSKDDPATPASKRAIFYTRILSIQLAAEQNMHLMPPNWQRTEFHHRLAKALLKQAYNKLSPDDPRAVKDIRDLRFMADVFDRQTSCADLFELWDNPPPALEGLMKRHHEDLMSIQTRLLLGHKDWIQLEQHCLDWIKDTLSDLESRQTDKPLRELCAWRFDLWQALLMAIVKEHTKEEGAKRISAIMKDCFGSQFSSKDRSLRLTYLKMSLFERGSSLSDCKEFWEHHSELPTCFADLLIHVEALPLGDQKMFLEFIQDRNMKTPVALANDLDTYGKWQNVELNVLKFDYLMTISRPDQVLPTVSAFETFIQKAIQLCTTFPQQPTAGYLAVYALLRLHNQTTFQADHFEQPAFDRWDNSRLLLQATMLTRHLVTCEQYKEDRTLSLFAARLHLNLGLGTCAFKFYKNAKCKEMLLDTLSPYILSRISLTHPFSSTGPDGFSADKELARVIETIERMEDKTDSYLRVDIPSFVWDQAMGTLNLRRKLKSSSTKQICMLERCRIGRLKGETAEDRPRLDYRRIFYYPEDNIDKTVFPSYEHIKSIKTVDFVMPNKFPNSTYLLEMGGPREVASRVLFKEIPHTGDPWDVPGAKDMGGRLEKLPNWTEAEETLKSPWCSVVFLARGAVYYTPVIAERFPKDWKTICNFVDDCMETTQLDRQHSSTTFKPKNEITLFHENKLIYAYATLELLRAMSKLADLLREKVTAKAKHPFQIWLTVDMISEFTRELDMSYVGLRDVAQSYIDLIVSSGMRAIKEQIKWSPTGKALMTFLKEEDVEAYAQEYVNSAVEAWSGVLKVKLK